MRVCILEYEEVIECARSCSDDPECSHETTQKLRRDNIICQIMEDGSDEHVEELEHYHEYSDKADCYRSWSMILQIGKMVLDKGRYLIAKAEHSQANAQKRQCPQYERDTPSPSASITVTLKAYPWAYSHVENAGQCCHDHSDLPVFCSQNF